MQYYTIQCYTEQYSTVRYGTVHCSAVRLKIGNITPKLCATATRDGRTESVLKCLRFYPSIRSWFKVQFRQDLLRKRITRTSLKYELYFVIIDINRKDINIRRKNVQVLSKHKKNKFLIKSCRGGEVEWTVYCTFLSKNKNTVNSLYLIDYPSKEDFLFRMCIVFVNAVKAMQYNTTRQNKTRPDQTKSKLYFQTFVIIVTQAKAFYPK
ncbi:hypothetical protein J3Q64DRAFT_1824177 [Phycomyces blakesleeanus]|uniref:Uncharacterized protein n=2 Tax=Phycomyces blakesleeanus TaxID=4837 RepID=A0A162TDY8_PHYB8|nr:hypothetical protein PHYBLDRAFT_173747 [Phycomyces blakesleeanus NRRL 1555(-)]OAD67832.1 hypothetical protein PHYBLDRAFT_173747 [Phycomyces blakesleeanus NRRL 1555(-)]|eukprot:XP_018285872.1 hypothetical protein PHYBLDRAFT_173747 [Phycomyces blakesleeanus NRRL 1555(-)]